MIALANSQSPVSWQELRRVRIEKLRWHSRRALLELDILLSRFWERCDASSLSETQLYNLESLLALEDCDLWALISGRLVSNDAGQRVAVEQISRAANDYTIMSKGVRNV